MLSFYEMNCLLEKANKSNKTVSEASEAMKQRLAAIAAAQKAKSTAKPAELESPTPPQAAAAPQQAPAASPVTSPLKSTEPPKSMGGTSPNEPGTAAHTANFEKNIIDRGREGIRPANHKAQPNQADNGSERDTEAIAMFNNMLISDNSGPSQRGLTAMAVADLKMPYQVPEGKFEIGTMSRGKQARADNELIMPLRDIKRLMFKVSSYTKNDKGSSGYGTSVNLRQALAKGWDSRKGINPIILRALQFEKYFLSPDLVGQTLPPTGLIAQLSKKAGPPTTSTGTEGAASSVGLQGASADLDGKALKYIIAVADAKGFGDFFKRDNSNPNDPKITILSPSELGSQNDPAKKFRHIGSMADRINSKFGSAPAPQEECNQWMDMMDVLEHWNFKNS
jgi:hypothetical protein